MAALLHGGQLILEVHAGRACGDHGLHELEGVEDPAETRLGVGDDGREVVDAVVDAFGPLNLVGAPEGVVDPVDQCRDRIHRVQGLVGIHGFGVVGVCSHLPARAVDGLDACLDLLNGLTAGDGPEGVDEILVLQVVPQLVRAVSGQHAAVGNGAAQIDDVGGGIAALDILPAGVGVPFRLQFIDLLVAGLPRDEM